MFKFNVQTLPSGVLLVTLKGKLCKCEAANQLRDALREASGEIRRRVVLDFAEVSFIDSFGIGYLTILRSLVRRDDDAPVVIARPHDQVSKVLRQVQLELLFDIVDDLNEAISSASR
ncbi:STAS domain-containing protein [Candidatus Sumerlaeota bacterium]|nr:STAS domain-containing protein [Candidatus Sumerlaeota bacterium]